MKEIEHYTCEKIRDLTLEKRLDKPDIKKMKVSNFSGFCKNSCFTFRCMVEYKKVEKTVREVKSE